MDFKLDMANKNGILFLAFAFLAHPAFANITINGTSYSSGINLNTANATWTISGTAAGYVQVKQNCTIILDNVTWTDSTTKTDAIQITDGLTVNLQLKGTNKITCSASDGKQTGIRVTSGTTLNITNLTDDASLAVTATGVRDCAIGGSYNDNSSKSSYGTINIYGGKITAKSGQYSAGIGSFASSSTSKLSSAGRVNIYGGNVVATCTTSTGAGAGIGGGCYGVGGAFYNYGGTVYATRGGSSGGDIGSGSSGASSSATFYISGGSTGLANGSVTGMANAVNPAGERVYRIVLTGLAAGKKYVFDGLSDKLSYTYGQNNLVADSSGQIHVWLPPNEHVFTFDKDGKRYQYATANATGKQTLSPTEVPTTSTITFKDWDGTTIDEYTGDIGVALTSPANPSRTGYTFTGWSPEVPSAFPEKDTTYTAQYMANQYTLTFYDEDETTVLDTITQDCDSAVTAPSPAKAEYIFSGWSPDVPATMPPGNRSFTAKWELAPYFRLVSAIPGADGKVTVKYDSYNTDLTKGNFTLTVKDANGAVAATVTEWETAPSTEPGEQTAVWNANDFISALANPADYTFTLSVGAEAEAKYLVIDLSNGSKTYLADVPEGGWTDEYKTTKLVLRRILGEGETATFTMGSPTTEAGRIDNETQHSVTLTKPYWMGVFEFTQGQWAAVKGSSPSCTFSGATRPVETVAWADLKGAITSYGETSATGSSFFGTLRSLVGSESGLNLPTEAEWEYACRAGTTSAFNDGSELTASDTRKSNALDAIAVYDNNSGDTTAVVGTKAPNAWGLYDMHGNVREWCHDQSVERTTDATDLGSAAATDPVASSVSSSSNPYRVTRGGSWYNYANGCRSARRTARFQENGTATVSGESYTGFRVAAREFAGVAKVGSQIDAENTVSATLGKKPRKGLVIMFY